MNCQLSIIIPCYDIKLSELSKCIDSLEFIAQLMTYEIWIIDITNYWYYEYSSAGNGQWAPDANTVNPTNGLDEPLFIDLTYDDVEELAEVNVKVWSADHEFVVENSDDAHYTMTVYNMLGQSMMQKQISAGSTQRISHNLSKGLYIISLQNNQNMVSQKVIVR